MTVAVDSKAVKSKGRDKPVRAQSAVPTTLLMCAPKYYGLKYEINPWMHTSHQPNLELARVQWNNLYRLLTGELRCDVRLIRQQLSSPDMVFTANAGLVVGNKVLMSRFRFAERSREEPAFSKWFTDNGFDLCVAPDGVRFEGEGDALIAASTVLAGYMKRSDIASHEWIAETLRRRVISLALTDSRWYHLDTCLFALDSTSVVFYPGAFDSYGCSAIRNNFDTIVVSEGEALKFACNSIVVGTHVVMPSGCPQLSSVLTGRGYNVHPVDMSEFMKAGGAAKCLTLFLRRHGEKFPSPRGRG